MRRAALLAAALVAVWLLAPRPGAAHGGPPLRIGVPLAQADAVALGRLALTHLRDGVGYAVDWRPFPDAAARDAAFAAGRLDIAVGSPAPAARAGERLVTLPLPAGTATGDRAGAVVSAKVLDDVRFTILPAELEKLFGSLVPEDLAAVTAAERAGGDRAAAGAARDIVLGKRLP